MGTVPERVGVPGRKVFVELVETTVVIRGLGGMVLSGSSLTRSVHPGEPPCLGLVAPFPRPESVTGTHLPFFVSRKFTS